jgi:hypothetical protein
MAISTIPKPKDKGNKVPKFNPDNHEDAPR